MEERFTLDEIIHAVGKAYVMMSYHDFVITILQTTPHKDDVQQIEQWQSFQAMCNCLLRFPREYLARVVQTDYE